MGKVKYVYFTNRTITTLGLKNSSANLLPVGSIIISTRAPIGYIVINKKKMSFNQGCKGIIPKDIINEFLYYLLLINNVKLENLGAGNTFKELSVISLKKLKIEIPTLPEQQKIAECLSSLDEVIELHEKKLKALKTFKKGLMQQLFPQEGETIPRLRFPEFKDAGPWKVKRTGDIFKITRGEVLSMKLVSETPSTQNPYPVYSSQTKNNGLSGYYSGYLYEDAITWTTDGANAGDVKYRKGKFYCTNVCGVLINKDGYANSFVAELLNTVTKKYVSYVGNPKLMNGVMAQIQIPLPQIKEQQKIADCLSSLDEVIELHEKKLKALKTFKKGLMQQLFPQEGNEEE